VFISSSNQQCVYFNFDFPRPPILLTKTIDQVRRSGPYRATSRYLTVSRSVGKELHLSASFNGVVLYTIDTFIQIPVSCSSLECWVNWNTHFTWDSKRQRGEWIIFIINDPSPEVKPANQREWRETPLTVGALTPQEINLNHKDNFKHQQGLQEPNLRISWSVSSNMRDELNTLFLWILYIFLYTWI
jgi:hypothetical protein